MRLLLALLLLAAPAAYAEEWTTFPESGVQGFLGLDDSSAPTQVQNGRAQDLQNVLLDTSQSLQKRFGYDKIGNTLDITGEDFCAVTGLYYTKFSSGTEKISAICGSRWHTLSGSTWGTETASGITITSGQNNQFVFTTALDEVITTNDVDVPLRYNGTVYQPVSFGGLSTSATPVKAKTVAFFKNYLMLGNTVENTNVERPTRLRWANVGELSTWTDEDFVDIGALGGQEIVALAELYDNLYVFLTDSIYRVSLVGGADTFQISKVTDGIGCVAKNSVQNITLTNAQNGLVFLDKDKRIYFFNGVIAQDIGSFIDTTLSALSGSRLQYAVSANTGDDYLLSVTNGTGSTNNLILDLEYSLGEWTKHTTMPANAMAHVLDANSNDQVYFGSYKSFIYQYQDEDLRNDVFGFSGTVSSADTYTTPFAASQPILYTTAGSFVSGEVVGAPIKTIGGTGSNQTNTVIYNTTSGLVVSDAWATTPDSTTTFEVGAIDSYYTTKWYDFGLGARLKHFGEVYFWGDADTSSAHSLAYATDYNSDIETLSITLSSSTTDAIWGSAIWGTALWGETDVIFREAKVTGSGRYFRLKFSEDDVDQTFNHYGFNVLYHAGEVD